jgi:hypothetical protein
LGNEFFGKKGEKPSEENPSEEKLKPKENPKPKPKPKPFHCEHCWRDGHLAEFCFRRKHEERLARELANKDRYRPSRGVPEPRLVPSVNTKNWYRKGTDLWAEFGDEIPFGKKNLLRGFGKGCLRSAMHHHSAKGLFALLKGSFRECVVTWPDIRKE